MFCIIFKVDMIKVKCLFCSNIDVSPMYLFTLNVEYCILTRKTSKYSNRPWICKDQPNSSPTFSKYLFVPEFNRRPSNSSLRPISLLVMLRCHLACCDMLYTCHPISHVYKDQFDGNATNLSFNFSLSIFFVFPILPFF